jgi:hypothetical protein
MGQNDSSGQLHHVLEPTLPARAHAAWVVLGRAGGYVTDHVPPALRRDAEDILWMLDVLAPDVLRHRPKRRHVVRKVRASKVSGGGRRGDVCDGGQS